MSTSLSVIIRRFAVIFAAAGVAFAVVLLFSFDVIKIDWPSFMEIQPSYRPMENPLPVPERSIPIEGQSISRIVRSCLQIRPRQTMPRLHAGKNCLRSIARCVMESRGKEMDPSQHS